MATRDWTTPLGEEFSHPPHTHTKDPMGPGETPGEREHSDLGESEFKSCLPLGPHGSHLEVTLWSLQARDKDRKRCIKHARSGLQLRGCECLAPDAYKLSENHAHSTAVRTEAWGLPCGAALDPRCRVGRSKARQSSDKDTSPPNPPRVAPAQPKQLKTVQAKDPAGAPRRRRVR